MSPDSLRRMVDRADRERATPSRLEPDRLILPPRNVTTRRICIDCRRVHDPHQHYTLWFTRMQQLPPEDRTPYAPKQPCRECGGKLIGVTG